MEIKRIWLTGRCQSRGRFVPCYRNRPGIKAVSGAAIAKSLYQVAEFRSGEVEMPKPKASKDLKRTAASSDALIASALRTLETEAAGINALAAAIGDGLGEPSSPPSS